MFNLKVKINSVIWTVCFYTDLTYATNFATILSMSLPYVRRPLILNVICMSIELQTCHTTVQYVPQCNSSKMYY